MVKKHSSKLKRLNFKRISSDRMNAQSKAFLKTMLLRRSIRHFSKDLVPINIIKDAVKAASSAPSGANKQPWHFTIVKDSILKKKIRSAAEKEEKKFYQNRAPDYWLEDLKKFETNWEKPFLEDAPFLIAVFKKTFTINGEKKTKNYYVNESVGIASGFLLTALHNAGLATLTHTPAPMGFLEKLLNRPNNEKAILLIPVGFPSDNAEVPDLKKKLFKNVCNII
jgi:iodotyrosine deiodinase